ncbi:protein-S-isoprenylcysteine O-methyltransferase [Pseudorhodoplanes sp.]|uniref:protein-S-isoprenylcysteine O-methyltransferase n=1 Tax=Pseudorhodoplanes sp. TaxID=1934341 RepID=UPI002B6C5098|nr:protein-S-isoprenylcysteine O-methyltransferase [Pseudorhodoplanes sp.]HWV53217.1 protein-S-isoprenylcysteine O-methyltransferase [Pseudorhodoplanes sp.]
MTPAIAKAILVIGAVSWFIIRWPHQRRSWKTKTRLDQRSTREKVLLTCSFTGLGIIPFFYVISGRPRFADYTFQPILAYLGAAVFVASLWLFYRVHRELGRNWSDSLEVREQHALVTDGLYRYVRHPMYSAFFMWAVAQALLLPNWIAGLSGLVGFGTLFLFRVGKEEEMMLNSFGDEYRAYMKRTARLIPGIY